MTKIKPETKILIILSVFTLGNILSYSFLSINDSIANESTVLKLYKIKTAISGIVIISSIILFIYCLRNNYLKKDL